MDVLLAGEITAPDIQLTWPPRPPSVELPGDEIHVWGASLHDPGLAAYAKREMLAPEERERAAKFHFERDRKSFVVRRSVMRAVLGSYLRMAAADVPLVYEEWGKPRILASNGDPPLHFNFSHSRGLALCAVGRFAALGVDVEKLRPMPEMAEIGATFCSPQENALIKGASDDQRLEVFFDVWTRKEAYLKATGQGLASSLAQIDCSEAAPGWTLHSLSPAQGYTGTLAFPGHADKVRCWRWEVGPA